MNRASVCVIFVTLCSLALADDTAVEGIGGNVRMMKGHARIRMVSEEVRIKLPEGRVTASFVFRNEGPATTVKIGFPESGTRHAVAKGQRTYFDYFRSYVDGRKVAVKREGSLVQRLDDTDDGGYKMWWTKSVHFGANQTRTITNEYVGGMGGDTTNHRFFTYVLQTGATWKGKIGRAKIFVDYADLGTVSDLDIQGPSDFEDNGRSLIWDVRNLEPTSDDDIHVNWWNGFKDVVVNDKSVYAEYRSFTSDLGQGIVPPTHRSGDVVLPVRAAAAWLGCKLEKLPNRDIRLTRGTKSLLIHPGKNVVGVGRFKRAPFYRADGNGTSLIVELRPIVKALGGKSFWYGDDPQMLHVRLP